MANIFSYEGITFAEIEKNITQYEEDRAFEEQASKMESCIGEDYVVRSNLLEESK